MRRFGLPLMVPLAAMTLLSSPPISEPVETEGIAITRTEIDESGAGTIEFALPAAVAGSIDVATSTTLTENGAVVPATVEQVPSKGLEIVLLIDTSGSMKEGDALDAAKAAALGFLDALPPEVRVGVVSFADTPALTSPMGVDRAATKAAIEQLSATGETSLYDAIVFSELLFSGATADQQIIVLSDGGDTVSGNTIDDATAVASRIRTSAITLVSSEADLDALQQLADAGAGLVAPATDPTALAGLYRDAADVLLNRYRLGFSASAAGEVVYAVEVATPDGVLEASTEVEVTSPIATTLPGTATTDGSSTSTTVAPSSTTPGSTPASTSIPAVGQDSDDGGPSGRVLLVIGATAIFLALLLVMLVLLLGPRSERRTLSLHSRKASPLASGNTQGAVAKASEFAEDVLDRRGERRSLENMLDVAGIPLRTGEFALVCLAGGVGLTLLLAALMPPLLGIVIGAIATPLLARWYLDSRIERRRAAFVEQLPDVLQSMVSSLRAGYGLPQSLDLAAEQAADPARSELRRVLFEVRVGRDPGEALAAAAERMQSRDFTWVVAALQINREIGGELAAVLETVAETIRGRQRLRRQIRVLTAEGRLSVYILIALPVLLTLYMLLTQPDYYEPFSEPPGIYLPVISVVLLLIGWLWMRRIVRSDT